MRYNLHINKSSLLQALLLLFSVNHKMIKVETVHKIINNLVEMLLGWDNKKNVENISSKYLLQEMSEGLALCIYHQVSEEFYHSFHLDTFGLSVVLKIPSADVNMPLGLYITEDEINEVKVEIK